MLSILGWLLAIGVVVLIVMFGGAALGAGIGNLIVAIRRKKPGQQ
ncbi:MULTISPECIES: hypothetical protein [Bradyrhizobium]|nr:hypothetical protein [Bradyrhizobium elkanii]MCP1969901.1 hypothetical protein [Bradyrhizobium elkanii]MCS4108591.1 hypothetical protein [Bradyrhizobium elkanii]